MRTMLPLAADLAAVGGALLAALMMRRLRLNRRILDEQRRLVAEWRWDWAPPVPGLLRVATDIFGSGTASKMSTGQYRGRRGRLLDYTGSSPDGRHRTFRDGHLVTVELSGVLPPISVSAWKRLPRVSKLPAPHDLRLESEAFNELFRIDCYDARYASAIMHPRVMELMLANPWLDWRITGDTLASWSAGRWSPADATARLDLLCEIAELIPNFVLRDYTERR